MEPGDLDRAVKAALDAWAAINDPPTVEEIALCERKIAEVLEVIREVASSEYGEDPRVKPNLLDAHRKWTEKWRDAAALKQSLERQKEGDSELLQVCQRFVESNWIPLAGAAWRHYQKHDCRKGALVVPLEAVRSSLLGKSFGIEVDYLLFSSIQRLDIEIATLNPETSVAAVFMENTEQFKKGGLVEIPTGTQYVYVVSTFEPPPPEAHRRTSN